MRTVVIGAGGTGGLYGGLLARAGHEVAFLARGAHLAAIVEHGLRVKSAQLGSFVVHAPASDRPGDLGQADFVLFSVKTYDVRTAAAAAAVVAAPDAMVLTLQNGVEAPDEVAAVVAAQRVLIGTTALETTVAGPGVIEHLSPFHRLTVSELNGPPTARVAELVATLGAAGINASVAPDGRRALWQKAAFLIPFAAVTAAGEADIGAILATPAARAVLDDAIRETLLVAAATGHELPNGEASIQSLISGLAPTMTSSLARDFERGRQTELEALPGAVVRLGEAHGLPVPTMRALYGVLRLRDKGRP